MSGIPCGMPKCRAQSVTRICGTELCLAHADEYHDRHERGVAIALEERAAGTVVPPVSGQEVIAAWKKELGNA